ncbi:MAG: Rrf2 family transcriptional regulator [Candidatus Hinthialibacter antarcticus]|nr:Rrf2 family transcriptional regulator [Candidatus Hinthialibacter antarcticus]
MQTLLKLSDALALALHTAGVLAAHEDKIIQTQDIAKNLDVSEHHLQKVHQRLTKSGLLRAFRGPKGGFQLSRPSNEILLREIYEAIEGPLCPNQCVLGREKCLTQDCVVGKMMDTLNALVVEFLNNTTVSQLAHSGFKDMPIGEAGK